MTKYGFDCLERHELRQVPSREKAREAFKNNSTAGAVANCCDDAFKCTRISNFGASHKPEVCSKCRVDLEHKLRDWE